VQEKGHVREVNITGSLVLSAERQELEDREIKIRLESTNIRHQHDGNAKYTPRYEAMTRAAGGSIDKENFVIVQARNSNVPAGQQRKIQEREEDRGCDREKVFGFRLAAGSF
jgi:hypothetical protein